MIMKKTIKRFAIKDIKNLFTSSLPNLRHYLDIAISLRD